MQRASRHLGRSAFTKHDIERKKAPAGQSFEALEPRVLLSGTVLASVVHGNLYIRGDAAANVIVLDQAGLNPDQVRISGTSDTAIKNNNNLADSFVLSGITRGVDIRMGAGDDGVTMMGAGDDSETLSNLSLPGNVSVNGQGGANTLTLSNVQVATSLHILGATTTIANTTVGKDLMIRSGSGGETVALQSVEVQRNTKIVGGVGADILTIDDSIFHGAMRLYTGRGADIVQIETQGDPLAPPTLFDGPVLISLGAGDDTLQLGVAGQAGNRSVFADRVRFDGGPGHDTLLNFDDSDYVRNAQFSISHFEANTTAPVVTVNSLTTNDTTPTLTGTVNDNAATVVVTVDGHAYTAAVAGGAWTANVTNALAEGTFEVSAIATDAVGNVGNDGSHNELVIDTTAPVVTVDSLTTSDTTPTLTGTVNDNAATVVVTVDGRDYTAVVASGDWTANVTYALTAGTFDVSVAATDAAGNVGHDASTKELVIDMTIPTVSSTNPASDAVGVAVNRKIAATFSEVMDPLTIIAANVTVTGPGGLVDGNVDYAGTTMTFTPDIDLAINTGFIVTITTGVTDLAGHAMAGNFVWGFMTGATRDETHPSVSSTDPVNLDTGVALNKKIAAVFSEAMDPLTITTANFTVTGPGLVSVLGSVDYVGTTAMFTPILSLAPSTLFIATVTTGAQDLAGNALGSNFVWTFTTGDANDTVAPTVVPPTNPANLAVDVPINKTVNGTFSESMDPLTITTANFTLTGPGGTPVMGTVNYDALSKIASFIPSTNLALDTLFTATIASGVSGVKDMAGNPLASDEVWTFTTGRGLAQASINLGRAGTFAVMATDAVSGGADQINGDVGLNPGSSQGIDPVQINGTIHIDDQAIIDAQADLLAAYNDAVSRSVDLVTVSGDIGGTTKTPGLYWSATSLGITGDLTLDAQGDPNAIFIFQMGSTLTTGPGAHVVLSGGAKADNIFWQVGSSATLDTTTIFYGNILANVSITVNTGSVVTGRLLGGTGPGGAGSVTIESSTVTVPAA